MTTTTQTLYWLDGIYDVVTEIPPGSKLAPGLAKRELGEVWSGSWMQGDTVKYSTLTPDIAEIRRVRAKNHTEGPFNIVMLGENPFGGSHEKD